MVVELDARQVFGLVCMFVLIMTCVAGMAWQEGMDRGRQARQRQYEQMDELKRRYLAHRR